MAAGTPSFTGDKPLDEYVKNTMVKIRGCQKLAQELQGWQHFRDYPGVRLTMDQVNSKISSLINGIFKHQDIKLDISQLRLSEQLEMIREGNDALLERINSDIDDASGLRKNQDAELLPPVIKKIQAPVNTTGKQVVLVAARNVQKPQLFFEEKVNNSAKQPFIPMIKEKPNSIKPFSILLCIDPTGREYYSHPYEYELNHWSPSASQLERQEPIQPRDMDNTPLIMIDTHHDLGNMIQHLSQCTEFAVDLEHHGFRSYMGLTCLMQISSRTNDYIVDTLALRGKLTDLNEVFTNPKIIKVIHGSDQDVLWLQRDCGVYLVNMFDTHQAAVALQYPHRSLAYLLNHFCGIQANKAFQRADWRIRPLPEDFIKYAREDTHYLLYIYDCLRNELVDKGNQLNNLITSVYERSKELCLKRYDKPYVHRESHMGLYRVSRKAFNNRQMFALRELYMWRDRIAREQDESVDYVLPKHMLLQICEVVPKEMQGILACCNPIPPLVKVELLTMHTILREAREQPIVNIEFNSDLQSFRQGVEEGASDPHQTVTCKHDLSQCDDNPSDLPCLLKVHTHNAMMTEKDMKLNLEVKDSSLLFGVSQKQLKTKSSYTIDASNLFSSPYERYTAYLEFKPLLEGDKEKKKKDIALQDLERVNRVKDLFMTLTQNTVSETPEGQGEGNSQETLEDTSVVAEGSLLQFEEKNQQLEDDENGGEHGKERVKKRNFPPNIVTMGDKIKEDKAKRSGKRKSDVNDKKDESLEVQKQKSEKRKSDENDKEDHSPSKVQKTDESVSDTPVVMEDSDSNEGDAEGDESVEAEAPEGDETGTAEGFNYDEADFSIFLKAQRKLHESRQKVKENFKGKNSKRGGKGKSSMKSFTWGGGKAGPKSKR